jgi:MoxR-like ATPase
MLSSVTERRERAAATEAAVAIRAAAERVRANIARVIVGKEEVIDLVLVALFSDGHILLEDVPGIGKTMLAKSMARSIGCSFKRIQFTPDVMPSDITGINFYNQKQGEFEFRPGPIIANIVLADEINRATPRTQSALLEAMEERQVTVEGVTVPLPAPFLVIATQNPIELEGTFPLPEAQLDRFFMKLRLGYPAEADEDAILVRFEQSSPLEDLEPVITADELVRFGRMVPRIYCEPSVRRYVVQIVQATRKHAAYELGASPRGSLGLFRGARALAAIRGRDYVLPDDVKFLAPYILVHRAILNSQARLRGRDAEGVLQEVLESVPVPVEG